MGGLQSKKIPPVGDGTVEEAEKQVGQQKKPEEEGPKKTVLEEQKKPVKEEPKKPVAKEPKKSEERQRKLPHKYDTIIKEANQPHMGNLQDLIHTDTGIFLNQKKKKYRVDESGCNCFILFARELSITWSEDPRYWGWLPSQESSGTSIEHASLVKVCWLEIHGKFETSLLTPGTTYEVAFQVMIKSRADRGWDVPVNLRLTGPDGKVQQHEEKLMDKPRDQWVKLTVGDLEITPSSAGEMEFSLFEHEGGHWKTGLVVEGARIWPKK